jgi:hypothetical protein
MFRKHKLTPRVHLFFWKPSWSSARFSSTVFSMCSNMIFIKILGACVSMLTVQYSSHFVDLLFFGNITIVLFLKSSGIFPVVYTIHTMHTKWCVQLQFYRYQCSCFEAGTSRQKILNWIVRVNPQTSVGSNFFVNMLLYYYELHSFKRLIM